MPLDTRLPLLAGQFQPISLQQPSRANMLAEVAQAASALQGLQRNAMAMREAEQERSAMAGVADMINKAKGQGLTPDMMRQMAGALGGMPRFVNESVKLLQAADEMERELRQQEIDEAEYARIFGGAAPAVAPAAVAAQPAAGPATPIVASQPSGNIVALQSIFGRQQPAAASAATAPSVPAVSALAQGPGQSDMIAGSARGTAQVNAMPGAAAPVAPIVNQLMTQQAGGEMTPELADAMLAGSRPAAANVMPPTTVPGVTRLESLPPPANVPNIRPLQSRFSSSAAPARFSMQAAQEYVKTFPALIKDLQAQIPRVRSDAERAKLQEQLKEAQDTLVEAQRIVRGIPAAASVVPPTTPPVAPVAPVTAPPTPAAVAAPQPEPAPVVTPRAAAPAGVQVAGPMVAGAMPAASQAEIDRLERQRESVRTSKMSAAKKKENLDEIDRKLGILREQNKPTELMRNYQAAVAQGYKGTIEDFRKSGAQQINVSTGPQEKAFESALGKGQADKLMKDKEVADDAVSIIETARRGRELLSGPIITGFGAEFLTAAGSALNQAGFSFAADSVANTQAFAANMAQNVAKIIKQFGAGTGLSNADREYAEKMAGGRVSLDRAALIKILEINERAARNVINRHNKNVEGIKTNIPLRVELPPEIEAASGSAPPTGRPAGVGADWTLKQDAKGNRAWVSPDGKRFVEVK